MIGDTRTSYNLTHPNWLSGSFKMGYTTVATGYILVAAASTREWPITNGAHRALAYNTGTKSVPNTVSRHSTAQHSIPSMPVLRH
jgi:hypothetical protein